MPFSLLLDLGGEELLGGAGADLLGGVFDTGATDLLGGAVDSGIFDTGAIDPGMFDTGMFDTGMFDPGTFDPGTFDTGTGAGIFFTGVDGLVIFQEEEEFPNCVYVLSVKLLVMPVPSINVPLS